MQHHEPTKAHVARRIAEGKTKPEIIRCLKRLLAREIWSLMRPCEQLRRPRNPPLDGYRSVNAAMESFWARMQVELLNTRKWATTIELVAAMADYIDNFYNVERRHSYLGNISPTEFETLWTSTYSIPQLT